MDVLALTTFLAPCLPFLLNKVGAPALEGAATKLGEDTWEKAKAIWAKLKPKVESAAAAKVAAEKLANIPDSAAWKEALQEELATILGNDSALADAIADIFQDAQVARSRNQVRQTVKENQGQVIGQMFGGEVKNIGRIDSVQGDVNL
ncbi:MAG: hypothetical protein F6K19_18670 [Cyanothece sp. SIO1E1]|nr:hypothetical protein [Cyanothece sp. SIO1E1]